MHICFFEKPFSWLCPFNAAVLFIVGFVVLQKGTCDSAKNLVFKILLEGFRVIVLGSTIPKAAFGVEKA
jgi:hypothetical protein